MSVNVNIQHNIGSKAHSIENHYLRLSSHVKSIGLHFHASYCNPLHFGVCRCALNCGKKKLNKHNDKCKQESRNVTYEYCVSK
jgi:hypothetical protein